MVEENDERIHRSERSDEDDKDNDNHSNNKIIPTLNLSTWDECLEAEELTCRNVDIKNLES